VPEARLNFADNLDGSFSCNAVFLPPAIIGSSYNPHSHAHQQCRILKQYIDTMHQEAPDDGMDEAVEVNRPSLPTEAYMHFTDMGEAFRLHREYLPAKPGYQASSPAHKACAMAHRALDHLNKAESDAIVTRGGADISMVAKEAINAASGNL
jgi:hypothetical protein